MTSAQWAPFASSFRVDVLSSSSAAASRPHSKRRRICEGRSPRKASLAAGSPAVVERLAAGLTRLLQGRELHGRQARGGRPCCITSSRYCCGAHQMCLGARPPLSQPPLVLLTMAAVAAAAAAAAAAAIRQCVPWQQLCGGCAAAAARRSRQLSIYGRLNRGHNFITANSLLPAARWMPSTPQTVSLPKGCT